jgi:hypothetical protein
MGLLQQKLAAESLSIASKQITDSVRSAIEFQTVDTNDSTIENKTIPESNPSNE